MHYSLCIVVSRKCIHEDCNLQSRQHNHYNHKNECVKTIIHVNHGDRENRILLNDLSPTLDESCFTLKIISSVQR